MRRVKRIRVEAVTFQIIPAVDVLDGNVVRLLYGDYDQVTVYAEDPPAQGAEWCAQGAALVHVVDLNGARSGKPDPSLWRRFSAAQIPFQVGGGIRTAEIANAALDAGATRVVMGTAAVWEPEILREVNDPSRVVAAVDVKSGRATGAGWLDDGRELDDVLEDLGNAGVERLLVTGISRDGTMEGPELDLMEAVARTDFKTIASGGVGSLADISRLAELGMEGAIVGRALYEGRFDVREALEAVGAR